jgi:hypothetical protein
MHITEETSDYRNTPFHTVGEFLSATSLYEASSDMNTRSADEIRSVRRALRRARHRRDDGLGPKPSFGVAYEYWYKPVFRALGYHLKPRRRALSIRGIGPVPVPYDVPGIGDKPAALVEFLPWDQDPNREPYWGAKEITPLAAAYAFHAALEVAGAGWGLLFAGARMPLIGLRGFGPSRGRLRPVRRIRGS